MKDHDKTKTYEKILKILIKEPFVEHTATRLSVSLKITRQGTWKTLNNLAKEKIISIRSIADTKKSTVKIDLDLDNPITLKTVSLILTKEALDHKKWISEFSELEKHSDFIILFGSILTNPREAKDIDILAVVDKNKLKSINDIKGRIQKTQSKEIHLIDLTKEEFEDELRKQNKAYIDALKKGIVLFGQDNYVKFMGALK